MRRTGVCSKRVESVGMIFTVSVQCAAGMFIWLSLLCFQLQAKMDGAVNQKDKMTCIYLMKYVSDAVTGFVGNINQLSIMNE